MAARLGGRSSVPALKSRLVLGLLRVEFPPRKQNTYTNGDSKTAGGGFQYSTMIVQTTVRLWGISLAAGNTETVTIEGWLLRLHSFLYAREAGRGGTRLRISPLFHEDT
jgi:hypothetical protein